MLIGGSVCTVTSRSATSLTCTTPAGFGANVAVLVTVASQMASSTYTYGRPSLISIQPTSGTTAGNLAVTLTGSNFGASTGSVTIGGVICPIAGAWSHTQAICNLPAGQGLNQLVAVTTGGQTTAETTVLFNYTAPTASSASPLIGPTGGGVLITLVGANFGLSGIVTIGGVECPWAGSLGSWSHTQVLCTLRVSSGSGLPIVLTVASQTVTFTGTFSYVAPSISAISPTTGSTVGGTIVTVTGSSFGADTGSRSITIGGASCSVQSWSHTSIVCSTPAGQGLQQAVLVTAASGLNSAGASSAASFSYNAPSLSSTISPTAASTAGGTNITLTGSNFGQAATVTVGGVACSRISQTSSQFVCTLPAGVGINRPVVMSVAGQLSNAIQFSYSPPTVSSVSPSSAPSIGGSTITIAGESLGGPSNGGTVAFGSSSCDVLSWSDSQVTCRIPAGQGTGVAISVQISLQTSNSLSFSYSAPSLLALTPNTGPTGPAGVRVTLTGSSFGTGVPFPTVNLGSAPCTVEFANHTTIIFITPVGDGASIPIKVRVAGQDSVANSQVVFSYAAPTITSISPTSAPTQGGTILTLSGTSLGAVVGNIIVTVGVAPCTPVGSASHTSVTCTLPAGQGRSLPVVIVTASQSSSGSTPVFFNYTSPTITSVSPITGTKIRFLSQIVYCEYTVSLV